MSLCSFGLLNKAGLTVWVECNEHFIRVGSPIGLHRCGDPFRLATGLHVEQLVTVDDSLCWKTVAIKGGHAMKWEVRRF